MQDFEKGGGRNFRKFERNIDQNLKLSHSNFVPFFAQNQVISSPKPDAQLAKGGAMPQFCSFFLCNFAILATQNGPMPPLNTPLIASEVIFPKALSFVAAKTNLKFLDYEGIFELNRSANSSSNRVLQDIYTS